MKHAFVDTMTSLTNPASSMPTITQAAPLAMQSHNAQAPLLYLSGCSPDHSSWTQQLESNLPIDGLMDDYPLLPASPHRMSGLGIFCLESTTPFVSDGISVVGCSITSVPTNPVDPYFDSKDTLHQAYPIYDMFNNIGHLDDFTLSHWPSGLTSPGEGSSTRSSDSSLASILNSASFPSLHGIQSVPLDVTPPMVPIVADINMFELAWSQQVPSGTVNPADTMLAPDRDDGMGGDPDSPMPPSSSSSSPTTFKSPLLDGFPAGFIDHVLSMMSASETADQAAPVQDEAPIKGENDNPPFSVLEPLDEPIDTMPQPAIHVLDLAPPSMIPSQLSSPPKSHIGVIHSANIVTTSRRPLKGHEKAHVPDMGTPVLDAHHGIHIAELRAKADRYRQRNPGQDIDKRWLNSFAGKLSERGELLDDFRCYVYGCYQTNKRRDHILIHVGSHVDQRPFVCKHWFV